MFASDSIEIALFALLGFAAAVLIVRKLGGRGRWIALGVLAYVGLAAAYYSPAPSTTVPESSVTNRPALIPRDGYVGSESCKACHPHEHSTWHDSFHRTMTQIATPDSVLGDFDNTQLELDGVTYKLTSEGDRRLVQKADDEPREIVMTTGSHHMQVYWFDSGEGKSVGQLPFVYLLDEGRWIPRTAAFLRAPTIPRSDESGRWNKTCLKCHATHAAWAPDETGLRPETVAAEFGISCEACHGPGEEHVKLNRSPARRYALHLAGEGDPTSVQPQRIGSGRSAQVCGQCHSTVEPNSPESFAHWRDHGYQFKPGAELTDTRFVIRRHQDLRPEMIQGLIDDDPNFLDDYFWPDGMVRVSGREYTGLLDTPCHSNGEMTCLSCHQLHQSGSDKRTRLDWADDQLAPHAADNRACIQCHDGFSTEAEVAAHTHHPPGSSGSQCYNCHMPHTTYGLLKAIRSHTIDSPRASGWKPAGRPNACNLCHLDKTLGWTANQLNQWFSQPEPLLPSEFRETAASVLWLLKGDAGQRALAAWHMGWEPAQDAAGDHWQAPFVGLLLNDPYDAVRHIAHKTLRDLPGCPDEVAEGFDFVWSTIPQRKEAVFKVMENWRKSNASSDKDWPTGVMISPEGELDANAVRAKLLERDDRRMYLAE